jgi:cell division protein FtsI/penicillin-binding protein 2
LATPIQLANFASIMANRGYYYTPHIIKSIQDTQIIGSISFVPSCAGLIITSHIIKEIIK